MNRFAWLLLIALPNMAPAQLLYDYLSRDVGGDILRKNQINMDLTVGRMLAQHLAMQDLMMLQAFGQERIAAGQASTTYTPSDRGSVLVHIDAQQHPAARQVLAAFAAALRDKNFAAHDVADCHALGIVLSYYGYWGEDPGAQRLQTLREKIRATLLHDLAFQGMADYRRQQYCERVALLGMLSTGARNEAQRAPAASQRQALLRQAQQAGSAALKDIWTKPALENAELTADGFGDRFARQAREGTGSLVFKRSTASGATRVVDALAGAGAGARLLEKFNALVVDYGGADNALPDVWATGYAWLLHLRERGQFDVSRKGWSAARDYMQQWGLAQPAWLQKSDEERQYLADNMAIEVMRLLEERAANRQALAVPPRRDPITGIVFNPVIDQTASLAEKAGQLITQLFVAKERPEIERLLKLR
jgi:hypothetical protein